MILVIGHLGNMGKRYCKILDYLKEPWYGIDTMKQPWDYSMISKCEKAIIACPTEHHYEWCKMLKIPWLCEKPITMNINEMIEIHSLCKSTGIQGNMVCNWKYALNTALQRVSYPRDYAKLQSGGFGGISIMGEMEIKYNCQHTGNDGLAWDCIQLIYMADLNKISLKNTSKKFFCKIDGHRITRRLILESYYVMVSHWLYSGGLWDTQDALNATAKVYEYLDSHTS